MSKREEKRNDDNDDNDDESGDDISGSDGGSSDESGSDEEMSESESDGERKPTGANASKTAAMGGGSKPGSERALVNQPFDEALDLSESDSGSVSEGRDSPKRAPKALKNMPFDEALELSGSVQDLESPQKLLPAAHKQTPSGGTAAAASAKPGAKASIPATDAPTLGSSNEVKNNPFDEEVDLSDSGESVDTNGQPSPDRLSLKAKSAAAAATSKSAAASSATTPAAVRRDDKPTPYKAAAMDDRTKAPTPSATATTPKPVPTAAKQQKAPVLQKHESESSSEESDDDDDDDDDDDELQAAPSTNKAAPTNSTGGSTGATGSATTSSTGQSSVLAMAGGYNESDFAHLKVSNDVRELFQYIGRFKAQEIELETRLKCFVPEFIPAVGDMDAFVKIPRPDGELDYLGLRMLDEPSLQQSDATVLDLQLRSTSKKKHGDIVVRSIEQAEKTPKEIDRWIKSIADLHRTKPPPQVHYTKAMPDIESLMQVWPDEFEELLTTTALPSASIDMSLEQYTRVVCALLDIPVHKNVFESLHVLFTLFLEFRSNQHFMNYDDAGVQQAAPPPFGGATTRQSSSTPTMRDDMQQFVATADDYSARK